MIDEIRFAKIKEEIKDIEPDSSMKSKFKVNLAKSLRSSNRFQAISKSLNLKIPFLKIFKRSCNSRLSPNKLETFDIMIHWEMSVDQEWSTSIGWSDVKI